MHETPNPLVSIITPFFNVELYLAETIESVIKQEYENWELILIDDGSFDRSTEIARFYSTKFPHKIFYVEHENHVNKGPSASRNLGLAKAAGPLLSFLDSDDYWLPEKLKKQLELLEQNPEATVICEDTKFWNSWSDPQKEDIVYPVGGEADKLYYPPALVSLLYPLGKGMGFCTCGLLIKKQVLEFVGGFDESFTGINVSHEDQVFFVKLYLNANIYLSSLCNNFYRVRPDSIMHDLNTERRNSLKGKYFFLIWFQAYLEQHNVTDKSIHRLLKKTFLPFHYPIMYMLSYKFKSAFRIIMKKTFRPNPKSNSNF